MKFIQIKFVQKEKKKHFFYFWKKKCDRSGELLVTRCSTRWFSTPADAGQTGDPSSWLKVTRRAVDSPLPALHHEFREGLRAAPVGSADAGKREVTSASSCSSAHHLLEVLLRIRDLAPQRMSLVLVLPKNAPPPGPGHPAVCSNVTFPTKRTLALISTQSSELLKNSQSNEAQGFLQSNIAFAF